MHQCACHKFHRPDADLPRRNRSFFIGKTEHRYQSLFTFKEAIPRLSPYKQRQTDPLVKLNEGNILTVPAYETRQLWIDVTGSLPAGQYDWSFSFVPVDNLWKSSKVALSVNVLPLTFPDTLPVIAYNFGPYGFSFARGKHLREQYFKTAVEYHMTYLYTGFPFRAITKGPNGIEVSDDHIPLYQRRARAEKIRQMDVFLRRPTPNSPTTSNAWVSPARSTTPNGSESSPNG